MSQISGATAVDNAIGASTPNRFSELTSEDFIQIIFTELTNQDPLQPNDTGALLDQLNSIRSIESDLELTNQLENLVTENQLAAASNMIGKLVEGLDADLNRANGFVVSVLRADDEISLELDTGQRLPLESVTTVVDPSIFAPPVDPSPAG